MLPRPPPLSAHVAARQRSVPSLGTGFGDSPPYALSQKLIATSSTIFGISLRAPQLSFSIPFSLCTQHILRTQPR